MEILKQNQTIISENQEFKGMIIDKPATDDKDSLIIELLVQRRRRKHRYALIENRFKYYFLNKF